jgi:hypothetical protein
MRALTLTQPWAGLVAFGIKLVENRPRRMIKASDFGKPFAIHASREIDDDVYARITGLAPELDPDADQPWMALTRITSAVIAVATLDRTIASAMEATMLGADQARWFFGPIGYVLRDVVLLPESVPCRGWQGFWCVPEDVEAKVRAQLARAA